MHHPCVFFLVESKVFKRQRRLEWERGGERGEQGRGREGERVSEAEKERGGRESRGGRGIEKGKRRGGRGRGREGGERNRNRKL